MSGPPSTRELARIELVTTHVASGRSLDRAFRHALTLSARALRVDRLGLWFGEQDFRRIRAMLVYDHAAETFQSGEVIDLTDCPRYAAALRSRRVVVADDAQADPRTNELMPYLTRHGITAMLDSPIFRGGELVGVVCHEHVGSAREWDRSDVDFASSVSDMLGLYLEQEALRETYEQLLAARAELERTRVMESLGRMAAGVAHDVNNLLGAIGMTAEIVLRRSSDSAARAGADDILAAVDQGRRMSRQLLTFAHAGAEPVEIIDPWSVLEAMRPTLTTLVGPDVSVTFDHVAPPVRVQLARANFEQVVTNLVVNARDAMIGGGRLRIALEGTNPGSVVLAVEDTGVGMDEVTRSRVFEPFFSTKTGGGPRGFGLAAVYGIVTRAGGTLDVRSALGEGTAVLVRLPTVP